MKISLYILVFICSSIIAKAELIDGPANVRIGPQKDIIFSLYDSITVDCSYLKYDYYKIGISIRIMEDQFNQDVPLKKEIN
jgi:hypothetical protein